MLPYDQDKALRRLRALRRDLEKLGANVELYVTEVDDDVVITFDANWKTEPDPRSPLPVLGRP